MKTTTMSGRTADMNLQSVDMSMRCTMAEHVRNKLMTESFLSSGTEHRARR
jgi:hypothetical protein